MLYRDTKIDIFHERKEKIVDMIGSFRFRGLRKMMFCGLRKLIKKKTFELIRSANNREFGILES